MRLADSIRALAWARLHAAVEPRAAGVLGALLLGIRSALPHGAHETFRRGGVLHFFAISGLHVLLAIGLLDALLRWGLRGEGPRFAVLTAGLALYALVTGAKPSVVRAAVMVLLVRLGRLTGRRLSPIDALSIAFMLGLLHRPGNLFEPSFALSFLSVAALVTGPASTGERPRRVHSRSPIRLLLRYLATSTRVTTRVWILTAPLLLTWFHALTPAVLLANPLLLPPVAILVGAGIPWLLLACLASALAAPVAPALALLANAAVRVVEVIDTEWLAPRYLPAPTAAATALYYAGLVGRWRSGSSPRSPMRLASLGLLASALVGYAIGLHPKPPGSTEIDVLDVGHGLAVIVAFPDGRVLLYDAGSMHQPDVGARTVAPALLSRGARRIDLLVLSHSDIDHTNGVPEILERFDVGRLVVPSRFCDSPLGRDLLARARTQGALVTEVAAGTVLLESAQAGIDPYRVTVLHPGRGRAPAGAATDNESSIVLDILCGSRRALLTGDVGDWGLAALLRRGGLRADLLLLPHHGAESELLDRFVEAVSPQWCVASAIESPRLVERLERLGGGARSDGSDGSNGSDRSGRTDGRDPPARPPEAQPLTRRWVATFDRGRVRARLAPRRIDVTGFLSPPPRLSSFDSDQDSSDSSRRRSNFRAPSDSRR